ncbi:transposase [Rhizobium sp. 2YAF20]|uniref:IS66-like element accessory protein TnpA n=1 Tax=Rhizobium sp. 2YAF20 TaxID=3233027 RepID=UPI003F957F3C
MDRYKDSERTLVSRLEIIETGRRRCFTDEAKLRIVAEGFSGDGRQVSATALKHGVSRSQLYRWRQLLREGHFGRTRIEGFVPAVVMPEAPPVDAKALSTASRMEVVSANGRRVIVGQDVDVDVLLRIMRGLETLR